ncbi:MAG: TrmB family transcriptional regulator [Nitrososphaerota archaeon]|nr:TrmB family transcriptional regulator [Nitrososphaerota archaeon]MDG7024541.1 TrmB family transcriptional regulator [Nitrososphaerota archaeon]
MPADGSVVEKLTMIGFTSYQAKVYSSLISLGVGSVSEVHRHSGVPRTKIYETLDELIRKGAAELQSGRPAIYRAAHPKNLVKRLSEEYFESAREVGEILEKKYQETQGVESDLVWTVKGRPAIRRKLAEILSSAKQNVAMLETYPPVYTLSVAALLKTLRQRNVGVTAVSVIMANQPAEEFSESGLIDYRIFQGKPKGMVGNLDYDVLSPLAETLSSPYGVAVVDRAKAYIIIPNASDESRSIGFSARIPGVPTILGTTIQRYVASVTRKVRV